MSFYSHPNVNRAAVVVVADCLSSRRNLGCRPNRLRGEAHPHRAAGAPGKLSLLLGLAKCLGGALIVAALATSAQAQNSVTLAWDPDPSGAVAGYHFHERINGQTYTNVIDVGNATSATVSNLIAGVTYFFAVSAYDMNHVESDPSGEIPYTVPAPTNNVPAMSLQIHSASGGSFILNGKAQAGQTYNVLASQDLKFWTVIGTVTPDASGSFTFAAPAGTSRPICMYRLQRVEVTAPRLQICASAGGPVILSGTGQAGQTYNVLASQDLKLWIVIGTVTTDASGTFNFADPAGTSRPVCMYRVQLVEVTAPKLQICASAGEPVILIGTGQPGQRCNVLSSQDLVTWTPIGTMTLDASGSAQFTDTAGTTSPVCMYRLQCVEAPRLQTYPSVGGSVLLIGTGQPGKTYNVLSSQDFVTWTPIGTMTFSATGLGQFIVPASTAVPNHVYQLQEQ